MGQRHQIYTLAKMEDRHVGITEYMTGFHNQWLYGGTAIKSLKRLLEFDKNADKYYSLSEGSLSTTDSIDRLIDNIYTIIPEEGRYSSPMMNLRRMSETDKEDFYPEHQDNNDGQTFIDFVNGEKPKYCFTFPFVRDIYKYTEDDEEILLGKIEEFVPVNLLEYFSLYYDLEDISENEKEWIKEIKTVITWIEENAELMTQSELDTFLDKTRNI